MTIEELQAINYHWRLAIGQLKEGVLILRGGIDDLFRLDIIFANSAVEKNLGLEPGTLEGVSLGALLAEDQHARFQREWLASDPQALFEGRFALKMHPGGVAEADWVISSRAGDAERQADHTATLVWRPAAPESGKGSERKSESVSSEHSFEINKADTIAHIARGIVHDFNNSLMAIRGHLDLALPETTDGSPIQLALEQAMEAALTTSALCQRLLNYAKGRRSAKRPCVVSDLLQQAEAITGFGSNVTCERFIKPDVWPILADGIQIVQVINNLLVNAQQAMPEGGSIALIAENLPLESNSPIGLPPGNYVAITVRDRGVGIPEHQRERIFEALYTTKADGSGLGLATCAQIVSAHDGYIDVHSVPNRGSEFIVYIPASALEISPDGENAAADPDLRAPKITGLPAVPVELKILVVEDQIGISKIAQTYLEKLGHVVVCAVSGEEALAAFREAWRDGDRFDLSIIDMTLPGGMNGEDTFRELCAIDPHMVGIATSGSMDRDSLAIYQQKGFATILPKPFPLKMLSEVVEEAMLFHAV